MDEQFQKKVAEIEADGKARFGEQNWANCMHAIRRATDGVGISPEHMQQIVNTPNASALLKQAATEQLLKESDAGNRDSEFAYSELRAQEREMHKRLKGRS